MRTLFAIIAVLGLAFDAGTVFAREVKAGYYRYGDYHLRSADGVYSGFGYELYEMVAKAAGWTNRFVGVDLPTEDLARMVDSGEIEILDCVRKTPERERIYEYSALPSGYCCGYMVVRADETRYPERDYANWGRVRVGSIAGGSIGRDFGDFAALHGIEVEACEFRQEDDVVGNLRAGRIDMAIVHSTFYSASKDFKIVGEFSMKPCYFCVKKGNKELMAEIDRAMMTMYRENPAWYVELRKKCLPVSDVVVYLPRSDGADEGHRRYLRAVACLLSAIGNMNPVFRDCAADFSDADLSVPCILAHVHRTPENLKRFDFPFVTVCRRPICLACDPADGRFAKKCGRGPFRIGYDLSDVEGLGSFLRYAEQRNIVYTLVPCGSVTDLRRAVLDRDVDLAIIGVDSKGPLKPVEGCGQVEFDFATPKGQPEFRRKLDMSARYMRYHEGTFIRSMERYAFGAADLGRVVRAGVYAELGGVDIAEDGSLSGYVVDYLREIAKVRNWDLIFVPMTYSEAFSCLDAGEVDVVAASGAYPVQSDRHDITKRDAGVVRYALKVKADSPLIPNRPDLWTGNRIGYLAGSHPVEELVKYLDSIGAKYRLVPYDRLQDAQADVCNGRLEGIFTVHAGESRDYRTIAVFPLVHLYFCTSKARPDVKADMDSAMEYFGSHNMDFNWWINNNYLRSYREVMTLDAEEIEFVKNCRGRKIVIGFPQTMVPVASFDPRTGLAGGFLVELFREIDRKVDLEFSFTGQGRADVYVVDRELFDADNGLVIMRDWFPLPTVRLSLPEDRIPKSARGIWAVERRRTDEIEYLRRNNLEPLPLDSRIECYRAVAEGRAEATIDNLGSARLMIDENREFRRLKDTRIDTKQWSRQVALAFPISGEPELKRILKKARTSIADVTAEKLFIDAIIASRKGRFNLEDLVLYGIITLFFVVILLGVGYAVMYVRRQRDAAQERTKFFFNVSHDIRTPVHAIMGFIDIGLSCLEDRTRVKDCLLKAKGAGGLLLSLIKSVLDMSRLEAGKVKIEQTVGDVYLSFVDIESTLRELAQEKDIRLTFGFGEIADRYVYADYEICSRIFVNIVTNAIKYTKSGGRVEVMCEQVGGPRFSSQAAEDSPPGCGLYRYTFVDNGVGMSEDFQKRLYEQFSRERNTTLSGVSGLGLGMAICRAFVSMLGGRIECRSKLGEGTTFMVTLPFRIQPGRKYIDPMTGAVRDKDEERRRMEESRATSPSNSSPLTSSPSHASPPSPLTPHPFKGKRALLVDDSKLNREVACHYLRQAGFEVEMASDGQEAVEKVKANGYDVVLMDIQMPIMGGYEATKAIRTWESSGSHLPIIAWTANAFDEDHEAALAAGMDGHVAKGVKISALLEVLAKFVK